MSNEYERLTPLRLREFEGSEPPIVSICTITFNHAPFIAQCIEGFLDQNCDFKVEIIIYDDASTDGTADIVREYAQKYPTIIKPILSKQNLFSLGVNPYYAFVFPAARGEFIAICDGDDYWVEPEKLAKQVHVLRSDPTISLTYGRIFADMGVGTTAEFRSGVEKDLSARELKTAPAINTATTCFRNPFLDGAPQFLRYSPIGDQTVWAILGQLGRGCFIESLKPVGYRIHGGGIFSMTTENKKYYMSLIAKLCIAAYHNRNYDGDSEMLVLRSSVKALTRQLGTAAVIFCALKSGISSIILNVRRKITNIAR